jgi:hypothetical protein
MPPGIEREYIVPGFLQSRRAVRQLLPRTIYEITLTEGKSCSWFTTIRALRRPVALFQGIRPRRNRAVSHLPQSGNSLSRLEDEGIRPVAHPITIPMATATRPYCNQPMASISISILPNRQIRPLADAESLDTKDRSQNRQEFVLRRYCAREAG